MNSSTNKTSDARYKLIKTLFYVVRTAGISEDNWRSVVERLYKKTSLKLLTTDEIKNVVDELIKCTGIELRKPLPKHQVEQRDVVVTKGGKLIELPTRGQLATIEYHADKMNMSQEILQRLIKLAGGDPQLSVLSARKLIEILKSMHERGWKDTKAEKPLAPAGRDN